MSINKPVKIKLLFWVALGGGIGAGLRYIFLLLFPYESGSFPLTIFLENITGSFLLGILTGALVSKKLQDWPWIPFLGTGVLGSFTTFSTYIMDIVALIDGSVIWAGIYAFGSIAAGLAAAGTGIALMTGTGNKDGDVP